LGKKYLADPWHPPFNLNKNNRWNNTMETALGQYKITIKWGH